MKIMTWDEGKGQMILAGEMNDGIFRKKVNSKKHYMRNFKGYCIQRDVVFNELMGRCRIIEIQADNKIFYRINFNDFLENAINFNYGNGAQMAIPCRFMKEKNINQPQLFN